MPGPAGLGLGLLLAAVAWSSAGGAATRRVISSGPAAPVVVSPPLLSSVPDLPVELTVVAPDPDASLVNVAFYGRPVPLTPGPDFTLIELPDTQFYVTGENGGNPAIFRTQTEWIAANRAARNIAYVAQVGDIVGDDERAPFEWIAADSCMRPLEDPVATGLPEGIPFGVSAGNHDIGFGGVTRSYNQYFGVSRFAGRTYYGGHFGSNNDNWYELFSAGGLNFIVIGVGFSWNLDPRVVQWADGLLTAYWNRRAILVSHYLLDPGPPATFSPQGQAIYEGLKAHANLMLMICSHYVNDARRADTYGGHTIHTVMSNYQNLAHGGDGWLRIMEFSPAHDQIRMRTYSPWLGQFRVEPDSSSQFTLPCDLSGATAGFQLIGQASSVPAGSTVSVPWPSIQRGRSYDWYVTVDDGSSTVTGPVWRFDVALKTAGVGGSPDGGLALEPVAPNPTPGPSRFGVALPEAGRIRLDILDLAGRRLASLADQVRRPGRWEFAWNGRAAGARVPAGVYFVRLEAEGRVRTRRFAVAR